MVHNCIECYKEIECTVPECKSGNCKCTNCYFNFVEKVRCSSEDKKGMLEDYVHNCKPVLTNNQIIKLVSLFL